MATTPRIAYDVVANAQGEADVTRLAAALEKVDTAIDPVAAQRAQELAAELRRLGEQRAAIDAFAGLRDKADAAKQKLAELQAQTQALAREVSAVGVPTRAQSGQLEKLRDATRNAKEEVIAQTAALDAGRGALTRLGIGTDQLAAAQVRVRQQLGASAQASTELVQRYQQTATAAEQSAAKQVAAQTKVAESTASIGQQLARLQGLAAAALGGSVAGQIAGDVAKVADQYNNLAARIRLVTGEGDAFNKAFQGVFDVASRTGSALESTGTLFARIAEAGKAIGVGQREALALTESIAQAVQISGSSAQASDAAITQLIQGLQSGVLRGEEFNSVMEQAPRLAKALADGLGVTTGELRKLAQQGSLTTDVVIKALQGQAATLRSEFETLPATVGRALQNLQTEWTRYVGEVDKSTGASKTAAQAIEALGRNIGTLVDALRLAGEAWIAYKLLDVAGTLARQTLGTQAAAAATATATAATAAHTAATAANTAAQAANARAQAGVAATLLPTATAAAQAVGVLGRLAGVFGLVVTAATLFGDVVTNVFKKTGTAIGEGIARLLGYKDRSDELAEAQRLLEERTAAAAAAQAAQNQKLEQAAEAALGLNVASKAIVADFEKLTREGGSTAQALEKVRKALDLGDVQGIGAAVTALDVLQRKALVTAAQVRDALAEALKGKDLGIFEAQARAAFDGSAQGVRRLSAALDALREEALRRAGTSAQELADGFSEASAAAINDVDALQKALVAAGANATDTGRLMAGALDKALAAANTERAVREVIARMEELGRKGVVAGQQLASGLEAARKKLDELKPGINTLDEALRAFGLKTQAQLQQTANTLGEAYRTIARDATVSLQDKAKAFEQWAAAATAANKGVETSEVKLQRVILDTQLAAAGLGDTTASSMGKAKGAIDEASAALTRYNNLLRDDPSRLVGGIGLGAIGSGGSGNPFTADGRAARNAGMDASPFQSGIMSAGGFGSSVGEVRYALGAFDPPAAIAGFSASELAALRATDPRGFNGSAGYSPLGAAARAAESSYTVNVTIGGRTSTISAASRADADAMVRALEEAARASGIGP